MASLFFPACFSLFVSAPVAFPILTNVVPSVIPSNASSPSLMPEGVFVTRLFLSSFSKVSGQFITHPAHCSHSTIEHTPPKTVKVWSHGPSVRFPFGGYTFGGSLGTRASEMAPRGTCLEQKGFLKPEGTFPPHGEVHLASTFSSQELLARRHPPFGSTKKKQGQNGQWTF